MVRHTPISVRVLVLNDLNPKTLNPNRPSCEVMDEVKRKQAAQGDEKMLCLNKVLYTEEEVSDLMHDSELDAQARAVRPARCCSARHRMPSNPRNED